jgi:hypothetical protein
LLKLPEALNNPANRNNTSTMTNQENVLRIIQSIFGPKPCNKPRHAGAVGCVNSHKDRTWILCHLPLLLCMMLFIPAPALSAVIKVAPDRDPVKMDESFSLVFSSEERVDDDPDFSPLAEDFEILGQNQGSQISIVNGKMSNKQEWTLTLSPKRPGSITIPAIAFGSDHSQPGKVTVLEAGAAAPTPSGGAADEPEIKLEVEAAPRNPYVQAQVIYTVKVLLRVNLVGADLSEPVAQDALIERLSDDHRYSTTRNGRDYTVIERKFAVFPQKSGLLRLDPMRLTAQVELVGRSFFPSTRAVRVKSEAVDLEVRPIPAAFTGKHWLPAADLKLEQSWPQNPPRSKAGEPITRTLSLSAIGVTKGLLPEMGAELQLDPSIKQYPDQPALSEEKLPSTGISSTRQEKTALIPSQPGKFKMPAVAIPWWNIKADRMEVARVPEAALTVEASGDAASPAPPSSPLPQASAEPPQALASNPSPLLPVQAATNAWFWLALFFGSGWLATGLAWWWNRRTLPASTAGQPKSEETLSLGMARKALRLACANDDPVAARTALLRWAVGYWPHRRPATLAEIETLGGGGPLADEIRRLNRMLYGNAGEVWKGDALWAAIEAMDEGKNSEGKEGTGLEPMYR